MVQQVTGASLHRLIGGGVFSVTGLRLWYLASGRVVPYAITGRTRFSFVLVAEIKTESCLAPIRFEVTAPF